MSAAAAPSSPFFDFEAQAKSPDTGFYASDDEAFAFKPLACKFHKFVLYECLSRFFVFGSGRDAAGARTFSLLEIHREEGKIDEGCTVSAPALADDVRYSSCRGTVVGAKNGAKWPVQLQLRGGGCDVLQLDASALVYAPLAFPHCIFVTSCTPPPHICHTLCIIVVTPHCFCHALCMYDGALKWSAQELEDEAAFHAYQRELAAKYKCRVTRDV